jgi:hypothetical protein
MPLYLKKPTKDNVKMCMCVMGKGGLLGGRKRYGKYLGSTASM